MNFPEISPKQLASYVRFNAQVPNWSYTPGKSDDMPHLQAEGAAKAWNLLKRKGIALLADEVGMGKTIQALAVMVTLWRNKPSAKILLYAPNEVVAGKWINEYENFIRFHYKHSDDIIKSAVTDQALRTAVYCENHFQLLERMNERWPSLFICKTSSLSNFNSSRLTSDDFSDVGIELEDVPDKYASGAEHAEWIYKCGIRSNDLAYRLFSKDNLPPFDLIVFDEAHYLRRSEESLHGSSNRSIAAHAFFNARKINDPNADLNLIKPLAQRKLLLTATPNHSNAKDVVNIVSLFEPSMRRKDPKDILNEICIRRYRRLAGKTKHEYRQEIPEPVRMNSLAEKLFFAAYQKSLVVHKGRIAREKGEDAYDLNHYKLLFGYLEGFEFLSSANETNRISSQQSKENEGNDFDKREDSIVIQELSRKFRRSYNSPPSHPKYERITEELSPKSGAGIEKKLVFVRRIPSVYEIARRVIEKYDEYLYALLAGIRDIPSYKKASNQNLRKIFWELKMGSENDGEEDLGSDDNKGESDGYIDESVPTSKILDLFTIKRNYGEENKKYKSTDCSNFRLRFTTKDQVFSMFFEPAADYKSGKYSIAKGVTSYSDASRVVRKAVNPRLIAVYGEMEQENEVHSAGKIKLETLMSIWYSVDYSSESLSALCFRAKKLYEQFNGWEKEGFSKYLAAGVLHSSPHIVHFYALYKKITSKKAERGEILYYHFCDGVRQQIEEWGLAKLIAEAIISFRVIYQKELGKKESQLLLTETWNFLKNTLPVYPVNAQTKRVSIVNAFNTPFYPNALISTSVLQEGVDLHYHCNEVIHYGIAWTQGDNEQRVGRVDRLFGKLENSIYANSQSVLPIRYPYLADSIDEEQLQRFIHRKHLAEQLIDDFSNISENKEINLLERFDDSSWIKLFNQPDRTGSFVIKEPYPVHPGDFAGITEKSAEINVGSGISNLMPSIFNGLTKKYKNEFVRYNERKSETDISHMVGSIHHVRPSNGRHQPVLILLEYFEPGFTYIGTATYMLTLKTPLSLSRRYFDDYRLFGSLREIYENKPLIKISFDRKAKGPFKLYAASQLPLFIDSKGSLNISENELLTVVDDLIRFSDDLEEKILETDIRNDEVLSEGEPWNSNGTLLSDDRNDEVFKSKWKKSNCGDYLYLARDVNFLNVSQSYEFNHEHRFLKFRYRPEAGSVLVGLYRNDALLLEQKLLANILRAFEL